MTRIALLFFIIAVALASLSMYLIGMDQAKRSMMVIGAGSFVLGYYVRSEMDNIAKILNMYPKKGAILVGSDADIVVWDPKAEKTIAAKSQQSAIDYNVFEGKKVKGLPRYTLSRGHVSVMDGKIQTEEGHGKFVKRSPNGTVNSALSTWKELTNPTPVKRTGIPASGV